MAQKVFLIGKKILAVFFFIITDFISFFLIYIIALNLKNWERVIFPQLMKASFSTDFLFFFFIWFLEFLATGLYTKRRTIGEEAKTIIRAHIHSSVILLAISYLLKMLHISRGIVILMLAIGSPVFLAGRIAGKFILYKLGIWGKEVIFIGVKPFPELLMKKIGENFFIGYCSPSFVKLENPFSLEGFIEKFQNRKNFDAIINSYGMKKEEIISLIESIGKFGDSIFILPEISGIATTGQIFMFGDTPLLNINLNLAKPWNIYLKNSIEWFLSILILPILFPILLIISLLILLFDGRPVIFSQERLGKGGRRFNLYKFRTMYNDADEKLKEYLQKNESAREEWNRFMKLKEFDPRVTKIGRFLRKWSLDELPQIFNVLKGEMSLIGPRPYLPREMERMGIYKDVILRVKPGITGLWQVSGRNSIGFDERLKLDEFYVRNWSLWLDFVILLKTPFVVLRGKEAY